MKYLTLFSFVCLFVTPTFSQVNFGLQGGINLNDFRLPNSPYDFDELYNETIGLHLGMFADVALTQKFYLRPQFQFVQRGSYLENNFTQTKVRTNLIYAELPVQFTYQINKPFFLSMGPVISYLIHAYTKSGGETQSLEVFPEKSLDFGITSGFGWKASERWTVLLTYYFALTAMHRHEIFNTQTFETMSVNFYNSVLHLSVAYGFSQTKSAVSQMKVSIREY